MKVDCIGGGPGGLYIAILMKKADPSRDVTVFERNRPDDTFGFGVVFSDATLGNIRDADALTYRRIAAEFSHWDDIDLHYRDRLLRSTGHGFSGLSRRKLLEILRDRCSELGVTLRFSTEVTDFRDHLGADLVVAADGLNSHVRTAWREHFGPDIDYRDNRFTWLGTTRRFPAFTFYFRENEHGLFRVHAYNYDSAHSTFIVECTGETYEKAGFADFTEAQTKAYCEALFAEELEGHPLLTNRSIWRQFPTVKNARWSHENVVLVGDAAHTAHFSIGSGTKLAMEDGIALCEAIEAEPDLARALAAYETARRPVVESTQRAAQVSLEWFEHCERFVGRMEPEQLMYTLLTRSLRINHTNLRLRDPATTDATDAWFAGKCGVSVRPPMFTPFTLRDLTLNNRVVVSPMCMYSAEDGTPTDWHLMHLGSLATGGAGLVMAEMSNVSAQGRISPGCAGMYTDAHVAAWKRVVDFCHAHSDAAMGFQLGHAGRKGSQRKLWEGREPLENGWPTIGPTATPWDELRRPPKAMDRADMDAVVAEYVDATHRVAEAGFDLVEIHMAHGYLLSSFLSPLTNTRDDEYGGDLEGRLRFPLEVLRAVRAAWPAERPLSVRISACDWAPGGTTIDDAIAIGAALKANGCDVVDVSTGGVVEEQKPVYGRLYQTPFSEAIRLEANVPTITVGSISSYGDVNAILAAGRADLCALARAHLFDPYWTRHAAYEQGVSLRWPNQYLAAGHFTPRFEWSVRGNEK